MTILSNNGLHEKVFHHSFKVVLSVFLTKERRFLLFINVTRCNSVIKLTDSVVVVKSLLSDQVWNSVD